MPAKGKEDKSENTMFIARLFNKENREWKVLHQLLFIRIRNKNDSSSFDWTNIHVKLNVYAPDAIRDYAAT